MLLTFRAKLLLLVALAALTLIAVLAGGAVMGAERERSLADVESRLVPKLELGSEVAAEFEHLSKGMQDAVLAQDVSALDATIATRDKLIELVTKPGLLEAREAATLREAIEKYDGLARSLSRRMIDGETGEGIVDDIAKMQAQQAEVTRLIKANASLGKSELGTGFSTIRSASQRADRIALVVALAGFLLVLGLSVRTSSSMLRSVGELTTGFGRFAKGDFEHPIVVPTEDEIGSVALEANEMAAKLKRLAEERDRSDWLKAGQVALADGLRGELEVEAVAERVLSILARRVKACAGALYTSRPEGVLDLTGSYGVADATALPKSFRPGEGLVGRTFKDGETSVVEELPDDYTKVRSGLGEAAPRSLLLVPLLHDDRPLGVLELAFLSSVSEREVEFLELVRPTVASALVVASSRRRLAELLRQSQEQGQRLVAQEEELRSSNQELQAQQEELRRANEELESQRRDLSQQNQELEATRAHLQQKAQELGKISAYKSQFLANMSHELRTPLNSMLLLSHLLSENEDGNLTEKQVVHCKTIHGAGRDLLTLINQILDLAKIEAGRQDVSIAPVELAAIAANARAVFEPLATEKRLKLTIEVAEELPAQIQTDQQRIERILMNLLGNAIKFTEAGEVSLSIGRPAPETRFERVELSAERAIAFVVSDTGVGVPPAARERIFQPFEQLESRTDRKYAGSGLGLAIARESAGLLTGELRFENRAGGGSTFTLYVPEAPPTRSSEPAPALTAAQSSVADDRERTQRGDPNVLVIEDDPRLAAVLVEIVRARGFRAVVAENGESGLRLARELDPQGIVLDVKLPDIDGWTVMQRLQANAATRSIPVHFISGLDERDHGMSLGAIGYLTKPATHSELVGMVRALTPLASSESRKVLIVEDDERDGHALVELFERERIDAEHVTSARAATERLCEAQFGCMILDLGLPDMDGVALLESLRERSSASLPPVIVHTGRALTKQETRQLEAYAEAVVLKDGLSVQRLVDEVRLFVRHVEERLPRARRALSLAPGGNDASLRGATILVAEDDMRTAYALSALLNGKGAKVLVAENGREALDLLDQHSEIGVVLMDVMMPEMDGYEALRRMRADQRFAKLPAIALTARAMKGERERCLDAGASDYLTKPVESEQLLSTLRAWLGRRSEHVERS